MPTVNYVNGTKRATHNTFERSRSLQNFALLLIFPTACEPVTLSAISGEPIDRTLLHLAVLRENNAISQSESTKGCHWEIQLQGPILAEICARAERSFLEAHSTLRVDLEGRLECIADLSQMIQSARRSFREAIPKS